MLCPSIVINHHKTSTLCQKGSPLTNCHSRPPVNTPTSATPDFGCWFNPSHFVVLGAKCKPFHYCANSRVLRHGPHPDTGCSMITVYRHVTILIPRIGLLIWDHCVHSSSCSFLLSSTMKCCQNAPPPTASGSPMEQSGAGWPMPPPKDTSITGQGPDTRRPP